MTALGKWWGSVRVQIVVFVVMAALFGVITAVVINDTSNKGATSQSAVLPNKALLGMSAPVGTWDQRVKEVGPGLQARRIFVSSFTGSLSLATTACNAGMRPVISFKEGSFTWAQIASGAADSQLQALHTRLVALPCAVFATIHHEPASGAGTPLVGENGTAAQYAAAMAHAFPILGGMTTDPEVQVGPIGNGWWFNTKGGLSDAQLKVWLSPAVLAASDFVASDTYQGTASAETVASKIQRMGAWARRTPGVRGLGLGEFNMQTPQGMTAALAALKADPMFLFGNVWNNNGTGAANAHVLTGAMLTAFQTGLKNWSN
jgi:hypothetical protein